jgi:hypothetical protein
MGPKVTSGSMHFPTELTSTSQTLPMTWQLALSDSKKAAEYYCSASVSRAERLEILANLDKFNGDVKNALIQANKKLWEVFIGSDAINNWANAQKSEWEPPFRETGLDFQEIKKIIHDKTTTQQLLSNALAKWDSTSKPSQSNSRTLINSAERVSHNPTPPPQSQYQQQTNRSLLQSENTYTSSSSTTDPQTQHNSFFPVPPEPLSQSEKSKRVEQSSNQPNVPQPLNPHALSVTRSISDVSIKLSEGAQLYVNYCATDYHTIPFFYGEKENPGVNWKQLAAVRHADLKPRVNKFVEFAFPTTIKPSHWDYAITLQDSDYEALGNNEHCQKFAIAAFKRMCEYWEKEGIFDVSIDDNVARVVTFLSRTGIFTNLSTSENKWFKTLLRGRKSKVSTPITRQSHEVKSPTFFELNQIPNHHELILLRECSPHVDGIDILSSDSIDQNKKLRISCANENAANGVAQFFGAKVTWGPGKLPYFTPWVEVNEVNLIKKLPDLVSHLKPKEPGKVSTAAAGESTRALGAKSNSVKFDHTMADIMRKLPDPSTHLDDEEKSQVQVQAENILAAMEKYPDTQDLAQRIKELDNKLSRDENLRNTVEELFGYDSNRFLTFVPSKYILVAGDSFAGESAFDIISRRLAEVINATQNIKPLAESTWKSQPSVELEAPYNNPNTREGFNAMMANIWRTTNYDSLESAASSDAYAKIKGNSDVAKRLRMVSEKLNSDSQLTELVHEKMESQKLIYRGQGSNIASYLDYIFITKSAVGKSAYDVIDERVTTLEKILREAEEELKSSSTS